MATLVLTVAETLRYRGKLGQWSWALHRIAGLGTLLFLFLHVIDTSWAVFYPDLYKEAIAVYQSPLYTLVEFALVACVVYHALNGFRIVIFDWRPQWWHRQAQAAQWVLIGTVVILIPTFFLMFNHVLTHYQTEGINLRLGEIISTQATFAAGAIAILIGGIFFSTINEFWPGPNPPKKSKPNHPHPFYFPFFHPSLLPLS